jgi:hypothetical protein
VLTTADVCIVDLDGGDVVESFRNRPTWREEPAHAAWAEFLRFLEPLKTSQGEGCQRRRS